MQSADRLVSAKLRDDGSGCGRDYFTEYTYNLDSAPLTIKRKGAVGWHEFDVVDDLTIHYAHGRPVRVDDSAPEVLYESSMDFTDLADEEIEMDYDRCGRLTMDLNRGITRIAYNAVGLPMAVFKGGEKILSMEYSADGTLLSRTEYPLQITPERPDPFPFPGLSDDAAGADAAAIDFVRPELGWYRPATYRRIGTQSWINTRLNRVESEYGYIFNDTLSAYYRDFQGNICAVVRNNQPIQATSYYPYGLPMAESSKADANRLKYSGKELVTHRGYDAYDFGPRNHLPTLCIFDNPDLLREKFYGLYPSNYCAANPIRNIDPSGMDHYRLNSDGSFDLIKITLEDTDILYSESNRASISIDKSFIGGEYNQVGKVGLSAPVQSVVSIYCCETDLTNVYEFIIKNCEVEVSHIQSIDNNCTQIDYIGTSHLESSDGSQDGILKICNSNNRKINIAKHSHTNGSLTPSEADIKMTEKIEQNNPDARCLIVDRYNGTIKEFNSKTYPGLLEEVIVIGDVLPQKNNETK